MPDIKFYCPETDLAALIAFRERHGKNWGRKLLELIKTDTTAADTEETEKDAGSLFETLFGDIAPERDFIAALGNTGAKNAVTTRMNQASLKYRKNYEELRNLFIKTYPRLSRLAGYTD